MHKAIQLTFPELEQVPTTKSELFLIFSQLFSHPDLVRDLSKIVIKSRIRTNTTKNLSIRIAKKSYKHARSHYAFLSSKKSMY